MAVTPNLTKEQENQMQVLHVHIHWKVFSIIAHLMTLLVPGLGNNTCIFGNFGGIKSKCIGKGLQLENYESVQQLDFNFLE